MKKVLLFLFAVNLCALLCAQQKTDEQQRREKKLLQTFSGYPDVPVTFGKHQLTKKDIVRLLLEKHPDFEDYSYPELNDAAQRVIDDEIYYILCREFLSDAGFTPSRESAYKYLADAMKKFPPELKKLKYHNNTIHSLAADRELQLSVALQNYLRKKNPQAINVTDEEVEYFYRVNQNIFMHDAKIDIGFIAVAKNTPDALTVINNAHSLLQQGVHFDRLANKINKNLPEDFFDKKQFPPEMAAYAAKLPVNEPSKVLEFPKYYAIIRINHKQEPSYIPLKNAAFFIRNELESRKSGIFLEQLLYDLLKKYPVKRAVLK